MRDYISQVGKYTGKTTLLVKFPSRIKRRLKKQAARENESMSEIVRKATQKYLEEEAE
jgi:metal-responsive CopG/Arc/MetJ family transcriptional regulator